MPKVDNQLIEVQWDHPNSIQEEQLLIAKRKHWFVLLMPIVFNIFLSLTAITAAFFAFAYLLGYWPLFISTILTIAVVSLVFLTKIIIDWHYHLYVMTSNKLLEIRYTPLSSHVINNIFLNQVRCAEVDVNTSGFLNELLDMGTIEVRLDRNNYQQEFIFYNIKEARKTAAFLSHELSTMYFSGNQIPVIYSPSNRTSVLPLNRDIFSTNTFQPA